MRFRTVEIILVSVFVAIAVVSVIIGRMLPGLLILGTHVPLSLLPFVSVLTGALLGKRLGFIAMLVYMLLGLLGLPIFADGGGGFGYIFKASFGFVPGFVVGAYVSGWIVERNKTITRFIVASVAALLPIYIIGILYMWGILTFYTGVPTPLGAITIGMIPFLLKDAAVNVIGSFLAFEISRRLAKVARYSPVNER